MSTPSLAPVDWRTLNGDQLKGWACALCGARLYADRPIGKVTTHFRGREPEDVELWACAPQCDGVASRTTSAAHSIRA